MKRVRRHDVTRGERQNWQRRCRCPGCTWFLATAALAIGLGGCGGGSGGSKDNGDAERASIFPRVKELIRLAPDADCAAVVPGGGAKVSAPGAAKLAAEARRAKGSRKKKSNGGGAGGGK